MDVNNYLGRIRLILQNVFGGKLVINEYSMDNLLKFLEDPTENSPGQLILNSPDFAELIFYAVENIKDASDSLKLFLIKIVMIMYKNEPYSRKIQMQFHTLCTKLILNNLNATPSSKLHLECIKFATMQLDTGLSLITEYKVWKYILYTNIHHKPKVVSRAAYDFMAQLVWKLSEENLLPQLQEVMGYILEPILTSDYFNVPVLDEETDSALSDKIFPYLSALLAVMSEADNYESDENVKSLLKDYFIIDHRLYDLFYMTKNFNLLKLINACLFRYLLLLLRYLLFSKRTHEFCNKMTAFHRNYVSQAARKRDAFIIVDYVTQATLIWSHVEKKLAPKINIPLTFERNGEKLEFSLQIVVHLIMPMVKYSALYRLVNKIELSEEIDLYIRKMTNVLTDYIFASCYVFGTLLEEGDAIFRKKVTIYTLKEILRLKGHITQSQAGPLFQSLYYLLDIFIACDGSDIVVMNESPMDTDEMAMLSHLLYAMKMLLKEHNIPWYENLEVICVQSNLLNLLKQNILTTKHVVQVLDLINICIMKFLSPNMSLLIESKCTQENTLLEIGKVLPLYMHHEDWEVRDSAFYILNTCTEIAFIKYIPLQKVIRKNSLIVLAAKAALTDPEYYPQCTALRCLCAATKIDSIWKEVLADNPNICFHLLYLLRNHSEGMVRKEAINILTGVFQNQKITPRFQDTLYEVMLSAALDDLYWEVQTAALNFWKKAIQKHLMYRGMLDGKFPSVTFSKEKRKIIVFNNTEIQTQLTGIMNHLSCIGCLTVLKECMNDMHNIVVMELAYSIAKELIEILKSYNFQKLIACVKTEPNDVPININQEEINMPIDSNCTKSEEERNKVIDSILSVNQAELMTYLHDNCSRNKSEEMDIDVIGFTRRDLVTPIAFLENFRDNDYCSKIETKKASNTDYVCSLDQLLDEILDIH